MKKLLSKIAFVLSMIVLGMTLTVAATLICTVKILHPGRLTPLVREFANNMLDARFDVKYVELSFKPAFPMLNVRVDSLTLISRVFDDLPASERERMPAWTDSLITFDRMTGALNISRLLKGEIALHNVEIVRPGVNIVLDADGRGNFAIYKGEEEQSDKDEKLSLPALSIDRFAFVEPREIRYFSVAEDASASIVLLHNAHLESGKEAYSIHVDGNVDSPFVTSLINLEDLSFGLDGRVHWKPDTPEMFTLEQFSVRGAFATAKADLAVNLDSTLTIASGGIDVEPVRIIDIVSLLPDSIRREYRLVAPYFSTDGALELSARLLKPFSMATDSIPYADATVSLGDCSLKYGNADFRNLGFDISLMLRGNDLDSASVEVKRFAAAGPATAINISGTTSNLATDPRFDVKVSGKTALEKLPPIIANLAEGYISGVLDMDFSARGAMSMLQEENFHSLDVKGRIDGSNLFYLSNDTAKMAEAGKLNLKFGSQVVVRTDSSSSKPMLAAGLNIDTVSALINGVNLSASGLSLSAGVENTVRGADTTLLVPLGGKLKVKRFDVISITDSGGMRARELEGSLLLRRYHNNKRLPELIANLDLGRLSAGAASTRFVISKAHLDASMHKIARKPRTPRKRRKTSHQTEAHPNLSPEKVYTQAIDKRRDHHGKKHVELDTNAQQVEVLEWDLAKGFRNFLLGWELQGSLTTRSARLFTPSFPLRNRINRLDISFTTDSVVLNSVRYRAGRSDINLTGRISNIRQGLTSKNNNSLKVNLELKSDTIDVNQLSSAVFAGAAFNHAHRNGQSGTFNFDADDDELDRQLDDIAAVQSDKMDAILIPVNIDGKVTMAASNIMYADLMMKDFGGEILVFDGGVNLHNLGATSDAGGLNLSALYSAPKADDIHFGFGLDLERINIERFLRLVPAIDSVLPIMRDFSGIIDAEIAATADIDSNMNFVLPSLDAAVRLTADSLSFIDPKTYATLGKWLRFRDRTDNTVKTVNVEMIVRDNMVRVFPFAFDIDRYRLAMAGYNSLNMDFNYHIAVLKSPLPFKFGINISGNPDKFKVRFGGAKFKENQVAESVNVVDTARVNLLEQIENVFKRGVRNARFAPLKGTDPTSENDNIPDAGLSRADSIALIKEGLIDGPIPEIDENNGK